MPTSYAIQGAAPIMMVPTPAGFGTRAYQAVPVYTQPPPPAAPPQLSEEDLKQVELIYKETHLACHSLL